jgi:hypothetical protein
MSGRIRFVLLAVVLVALGLIEYVLGATLVAVVAWAVACAAMLAALTHRNGD